MTKNGDLTAMQHDFVTNYIKNGYNAHQAALSAGYSKAYAQSGEGACQLVKQPHIQKRLQHAREKSLERMVITFDWKIRKLVEIIEASEKEGQAVNHAIVIRAIAELNKMQGDYAPDKHLKVTVDATKEKLDGVRKQYDVA